MELTPAILQGTKDRVRPVMMTKLTAILGMLPMALAMAEGFRFGGAAGNSRDLRPDFPHHRDAGTRTSLVLAV